MLAYHNDQKLKESVLAEMAAHREADRLVQGYGYWSDGKGCAVGCLIKSGQHAEYEPRFGIPRLLARLEDGIFEGLPVKEAQEWPERFLGAINPGADLSMVFYRFMHWLLVDPQDGVLQYGRAEKTKASIQRVADLYQRHIAGEKIGSEEWNADAAAAYAYAAAAAAYAAAAADAAYAAYAYADAAYAAAAADAAAAAYAYADADAAYAAAKSKKREQIRIKQADKLVELLKAA